MKNDFHGTPFSQSTKVKLALFQGYLTEWLPTFLHYRPQPSRINVVDFFSGPGEDKEHVPGSPCLILEQMRIFRNQMGSWYGRLHVVFNDLRRRKVQKLRELIDARFSDVLGYVDVEIRNERFEDLFFELRPGFAQKGAANLLFVDQSGMSAMTVETFQSIVSLDRTDLLFFISSSTLVRFHELKEFKRHLQIPSGLIHGAEYYRVHKAVRSFYQSQVPAGREYYMSDFSLKKDANIYGVIFGSNHLRGLDKFVRICWKLDEKTGQANYDIDRENIDDSVLYLFPPIPRKVAVFQEELAQSIKNAQLRSNRAVLVYYLTNGMLCSHAKPVLSRLKADGVIERTVPISYSLAARGRPQAIVLRKVTGDEPDED